MNVSLGLAILGFVILAVWVIAKGSVDGEKNWTQVAAEFGLAYAARRLSGRAQGSDVAVRAGTRGSVKNKVRYTAIELSGGLPDGITLGREGLVSRAMGLDAKIGDPAFDRVAKVFGRPRDVLFGLSAEQRRTLAKALGQAWQLAGGVLSYEVAGHDGVGLGPRLAEGLRLAAELREVQGSLGARLVAQVEHEALPALRLGALEALARGTYGQPALEAGLAHGLRDAVPANRLYAAEVAGAVEPRVALATDGYGPALVSLARAGHADETAAVARDWMAREIATEPEAQAALAVALGSLPPEAVPGGEAQLRAFLEVDADEVQLAAIHALGEVGSLGCVGALRPFRERILGGARKSAAFDAMARIQARHGQVEAGGLALSEAGAGAVALAQEADEPDDEGVR